MAIPLAYNLRNLLVRKTSTAMTATGIALTVAVLVAILALVEGLRATLSISGDPRQIQVTRKGATSELVSNFLRTQFQDLKFKRGIQTGASGQPLASLEVVTVINLANVDNPDGVNVTVRGLEASGIEMHPKVNLVKGRWFVAGRREVVAGASVARRFSAAALGSKLNFGQGDWDVVGVLDAGRGVADSEVWGDLNQIASDYQRLDVLSSALVRAADRASAQALINDINSDQRLGAQAITEQDSYDQQTAQAAPIEFTGIFVSLIMAAGCSFAAMNTMYAAVARRAREIGTLRVLGFSRGSILLSFFFESILLAGIGGVGGCLLALPLNGLTTVVNGANFSELSFDFRVSPAILLSGMAFALMLGAAGGVLPALMASRKQILKALREY